MKKQFEVLFGIWIVCATLVFNSVKCSVEIINKIPDGNTTNQNASEENSKDVTGLEDKYKNYHCEFLPGYRTPNRTEELLCCRYIRRRYYAKWYGGREYLTTFLDTLKQWKCPQLRKQCKYRFFDFTQFTNVVYMRACQPERYRKHCFETVSKLAPESKRVHPNNVSDEIWRDMVHGLNSMEMTNDEINNPCTQVALYEGGRGGPGRFHESVDVLIPFCGFVWCGYDADTIYGRKISVWTCMPQGCRIGIGVATGIIACLGIATIIANLLIIAVYWYKKRMNNSQVVYKVTLAIGDTLVGVAVFPTFISTFFMVYMSRQYMGDYMKPLVDDESLNGIDLQPKRYPMTKSFRLFPQSYRNAVGFFTALSIILSVYTLMVASFDRMAAVCRPMAYDRRKALQAAKYVSVILGVVGLIVATLPIYTRSLSYEVVASILISLAGTDALILYSVMFILPLVLIWISNFTLFIYSKKHTEVRRQISTASNMQVSQTERRLAKTLAIMVGAFTVTILPAVITLLLSFGLSDIHYKYPEKLNKTSATAYITAEFLCVVILTTNSLWNCFIYGSRDREFGKTARSMISTTSERFGASSKWNSLKRSTMPKKRRFTTTSTTSTAYSLKSKGSAGSDQLKKQMSSTTETDEIEKSDSMKKENELNEDSTWRSFAIDPDASKLYNSVMEDIGKGHERNEDESNA